jgi:Ca-activated chloride channel family protein
MSSSPVPQADQLAALADRGAFDEVWVIARDEARARGGVLSEQPGTGALVSTSLGADGLPTFAFPLESTSVRARLEGPLASVEVAQRFSNPYRDTIEAAYVFPLPHDAAVCEFVMRIGERRIRGVVRERAEAQRIYEQARSRGFVASLLTEDRPNIFQERIANIEPGKAVEVELVYFNTLSYADGWYEWRFPLVVGPRFNPPASPGGSSSSIPALPVGGNAAQGRVNGVEYLAPGQQVGHQVAIDVAIDAGVALDEIHCTSHPIAPIERQGGKSLVHLAPSCTHADRDFVLRYRVAGREPRVGLISGIGSDGRGTFALTVYPPVEVEQASRMPIDIVFVVDRSGSMRGRPLEQAKSAMRVALGMLRAEDRFQIVDFGSSAEAFGDALRWADEPSRREAERYIASLEADGGTMVIPGITKALDFRKEEGRVQYVVVLSDGFVSNEAEICAFLRRELGDRRLFAIGIGSSVNWYLMHRLGAVGRGAVASVGLEDDPAEPARRFMEAVTRPILQGTRIEWSGGEVSEIWPRRAPDLVAGRPITIIGRFDRPGRATATLRGWARGEQVALSFPVNLGASTEDLPGERLAPTSLERLWARAKIAQLADDALGGTRSAAEAADEVLRTALEYGISSPFTAFVAVDASEVTSGTRRTTVVQPVPVPAGVQYESSVGATPGRTGGDW